jgi:hypothetical protein
MRAADATSIGWSAQEATSTFASRGRGHTRGA